MDSGTIRELRDLPHINPGAYNQLPRAHRLPAGEAATRWGVAVAGVIAETEANSQEDNHTRLSLLCPYSFSDLDALMLFF